MNDERVMHDVPESNGGRSTNERRTTGDDRVPSPFDRRRDAIETKLETAAHTLVCLDFDGTLAPIVEDPADATITDANRRALDDLLVTPRITVGVVSGRHLDDVRRRVDAPVIVAGNHGLELERDGSRAVHPVAAKRSRTIGTVCTVLERCLEPIPNCHVEDKALTGTVHVRSVPEPAREIVYRTTRDVVDRIAGDDLTCSTGKRVIEFSPALDWGKGDAVELVEADLPASTCPVYLGDDTTDEHAFEAVEPDGVGVLVGPPRPSHASTRVDNPTEVANVLEWLSRTAPNGLLDGDGPTMQPPAGVD